MRAACRYRLRVRRLAALLLLLAVAPGTWLRSPPEPRIHNLALEIVSVPLPPSAIARANLGPFELEQVWQLRSQHYDFGGYSALIPLGMGRLLAVSDQGEFLRFSEPGAPPAPQSLQPIFEEAIRMETDHDAESAARDPKTGDIWIATESSNGMFRYDAGLKLQAIAHPPEMHKWHLNLGAESMLRLPDGRFVVLREGATGWNEERRHPAVIFPGDPTRPAKLEHFTFSGPARFSPVDMAQVPDGRVLVLMRRLVWPMPFRFAGKIALADPTEIRAGGIWRAVEVAKLSSQLPVDNFEGIAVEPRNDGSLTVWLISDDNQALSQRTLLWKMRLDPAQLPRVR